MKLEPVLLLFLSCCFFLVVPERVHCVGSDVDRVIEELREKIQKSQVCIILINYCIMYHECIHNTLVCCTS